MSKAKINKRVARALESIAESMEKLANPPATVFVPGSRLPPGTIVLTTDLKREVEK